MRFFEKLNEYIELLGCMAKDVGEMSGISAATLSRYRSGDRLPDVNSEAFERLCSAIAAIAKEKNILDITEDSVRESFLGTEDFHHRHTERLLQNFDTLVSFTNFTASSKV